MRARLVSSSGTVNARSIQPGSSWSRRPCQASETPARSTRAGVGNGPGTQGAGDVLRGDVGRRGEVESTGCTGVEDPGDRVGDVGGVHHRDPDRAVERQDRRHPQGAAGDEAGDAVPEQRTARVPLPDDAGSQPGDRHTRVLELETVEQPLGGRLVLAVRRRRHESVGYA